ncbi:hypothetical protein QBC34DRAFT_436242 [Podospora aff. communis PSN243]|uniref:Uncharacterized protein n=1 Tax=Podospora aff. communis PSN243 TaxID=3040156 RepID=A0AAV9GTD4_9PEZI|nr:hypothetical protein QBC34DRAFT_436242 [Podospora aff. communis PSN243]
MSPQLLPCSQYLRQTWPLIGEAVLSGLVEVITSVENHAEPEFTSQVVEKTLFDRTTIAFQLFGKGLVKASCTGLVDSLSEVVEILSWLGSALSESFDPQRVSHRRAQLVLRENKTLNSDPPCLELKFLEDGDSLAEEFSRLGVKEGPAPLEVPVAPVNPPRGDCWKRALKNPAVAVGFPVPRRAPKVRGLEISLDAMALLVGAPRLALFNGHAVLKGHNAAMVLAAESPDQMMLWHFICNEDGSRLPYSDPRIKSSFVVEEVSALERIRGARHLLGWASNVSYNIGSPLADYKIGWSDPDHAGPGCALEKVVISGGPEFLTAAFEFSLGRKDKAPVIKRGMSGYIDTLCSLATSYTVLYDIRDRRGWLSNGLHTLLHLVRASLEHDREGPLSAECLLDPSDLREDPDPTNPQAAINFLRDQSNLGRSIFRGSDELRTEETRKGESATKTEYRSTHQVLLRDRVNHLASVLEELIDHQASFEAAPGWPPS